MVVAPDSYQGAQAGDINHRRGEILNFTSDKGRCQIHAGLSPRLNEPIRLLVYSAGVPVFGVRRPGKVQSDIPRPSFTGAGWPLVPAQYPAQHGSGLAERA